MQVRVLINGGADFDQLADLARVQTAGAQETRQLDEADATAAINGNRLAFDRLAGHFIGVSGADQPIGVVLPGDTNNRHPGIGNGDGSRRGRTNADMELAATGGAGCLRTNGESLDQNVVEAIFLVEAFLIGDMGDHASPDRRGRRNGNLQILGHARSRDAEKAGCCNNKWQCFGNKLHLYTPPFEDARAGTLTWPDFITFAQSGRSNSNLRPTILVTGQEASKPPAAGSIRAPTSQARNSNSQHSHLPAYPDQLECSQILRVTGVLTHVKFSRPYIVHKIGPDMFAYFLEARMR